MRKEIEAQACANPESTGADTPAEEAHTVPESAKETIQQLEEENRRLKEEVEACVCMPVIGEILSLDINQP